MISLQPSEQRALLERFLRYVQVDTQSDESSPSFPSTDKQKNLARLLVDELKALGCTDAWMAESGHVYATVPSNLPPDHLSFARLSSGRVGEVDPWWIRQAQRRNRGRARPCRARDRVWANAVDSARQSQKLDTNASPGLLWP